MEVERRFRVREPPAGLAAWPAEDIAQGYLAVTGEVEVRVRRRGGRHVLTVKSAPALVRVEEELDIGAGAFERLWPLTEGRRLVKTRHTGRAGGVLVEIDVFAEDLAGLVLAEVEFPDVAASEAFVPPPWLGREVTGDRRWSNQSLAVDGLPDEPM